MHRPGKNLRHVAALQTMAFGLVAALTACGGGSSDAGSTTITATTATSTTGNSLAAGYKQARWGANMTVSFPTDCTMKVVSTGLPNHALPAYDLRPATGSYTTVVATTPDGLALTLQPDPGTANPSSVTYNICPTQATSTTVTNMGSIGMMISGAALFNAYDGTGSPAMQQNVSYTFTDAAGKTQTAAFLDGCNGHYTPANAGNVYHYHGWSSCLTAQADTAGGPSHIVGIALDGFPVYGGRDLQGKVITTAQLDACNGIISATPEFPNGVYHYVLPEGVTGAKSSPGCYRGTVSARMAAAAQAAGICTTGAAPPRGLWADARMRAPRKAS
jgi:hypothetical protein